MKSLDDLPYLEWTEPDSGAVVRLYADVITDESANLGAVVSQHAVEKGANITDHYRKESETVQVTYYFSGAPMRGDLDPDNQGSVQAQTLNYYPSGRVIRPGTTPLVYPPGPGPSLALLNPFNAIGAGINALFGGKLPDSLTPSFIDQGQPLPSQINALSFPNDPAKRFQAAIETVRRLQANGILVTVKTTFGPFTDCGIISAQPKRSPEHGTSGEIAFSFEQLRFVTSDIALALPIPVEPRALPKKDASASGGKPKDGNEESAARKAAHDYAGDFGIDPSTEDK